MTLFPIISQQTAVHVLSLMTLARELSQEETKVTASSDIGKYLQELDEKTLRSCITVYAYLTGLLADPQSVAAVGRQTAITSERVMVCLKPRRD